MPDTPGTGRFPAMKEEVASLPNHVVYRPRTFTPDQLLEGYLGALKEVYTVPSIFQRLWGTTAWKNFFYPMNIGFRQGVSRLSRAASRTSAALSDLARLSASAPMGKAILSRCSRYRMCGCPIRNW